MRFGLVVAAAMIVAGPALADVKAGVDAWKAGEYRKAVEEWRGPAVAGDADAQFNLGQAYKLGRGVPVDPTLAESWFRKAALQGHEQAGDNYALALFQNGRKQEAVPWLEKSIARDEPRTELVYGTMMFNGDGVARDFPRAYALMTRAAASRLATDGRAATDGLPSARETLGQMDSYITPADRERGTALAQQYALSASTRPMPAATGANRVTEQMPRTESTPVRVADVRAADIASSRGDAPTSTPTPKPKPGRKPTRVARVPTPVPTPAASPSTTPAASPPEASVAAKVPKVTKVPVAVAHPRQSATPAAPAPAARGGGWKIQLGAFRDRGNATALWSRVSGKLGGAAPAYVGGRGITRLQATGYANKAAAQRACSASGVSCVIVAP